MGFAVVIAALPAQVVSDCVIIEPQEVRTVAVAAGPLPDRPSAIGVDVTRGSGPIPYGCGQYKTTDCMALGYIDVVVDLPENAVGFALRFAGGEAPDDLELPEGPLLGDEVTLTWPDGAVDEQEAFAFAVDVVAVDAAGRDGPPVHVEVASAGRDLGPAVPLGCTHVSPGLPLGLALLLARRRR